MDDRQARLLDAVLASRKYRTVSRELAASVLEHEERRGTGEADLIKATRNRLHQVACAYQDGIPRYDRWLDELRAAHQTGDRAVLTETSLAIQRRHASTRERLPILRAFYAAAIPDWSKVRSIVDLGCGLNPLAVALLDLSPETEYTAYDVLGDLVDFLNAAFPLLGIAGHAAVCDVVHQPGCLRQPADLALALKLLPCLEHIEKGAGERLLRSIDADQILVSFPEQTLGGNRKGMGRSYEAWLDGLTQSLGFRMTRFSFPSELAFLLVR